LGAYALKTRRMVYNSGLAVDTFRAAKRLRPQFELDELRVLVSDEARYAWGAERRALAVLLDMNDDKRAAAAHFQVNLGTIYNRLQRDPDEPDPWWLPCCLMAYSGMRVSEAMHLRWDNIDWKSKRIRVRIQNDYDQKNDEERECLLQDELADILKPLGQTQGYVIESEAMRESGSALRNVKRSVVSRDYAHGFKLYLDRIGISRNIGLGERSPHSLRHAWVAAMLATGEGSSLVAKWAGHSGDVQKLYQSQADSYHKSGAHRWERSCLQFRHDPDHVRHEASVQ